MRVTKRTVAGIACALCCALCVGLYLVQAAGQVEQARAEALARYGGEQVEVCVATRNLAAGEVVGPGDVATKLWVADLLPEGAVTDSAQIVGCRLGSAIYKGEVVCARRTEVAANELSVPHGMAALSVPARSVQAVGGSVEPGMVVDVYATGPASTTRLVRSALVLATSAGSGENAAVSNTEWVTLAVKPQQVQELVAAAQNLELYFVLPASGEASFQADEAENEGAEDQSAVDAVGVPGELPAPVQESPEPDASPVSPALPAVPEPAAAPTEGGETL